MALAAALSRASRAAPEFRDHPGRGLKDSGRRPTARRIIVPALGLVLSVLAGWLAVQGVDIARVSQLLGQLEPGFVVLAICVVVAELVVRALRWSLLLPRRASRRLPTRRLLPVLLIGYLGNTVLPARIGDAARAVIVGRREISRQPPPSGRLFWSA